MISEKESKAIVITRAIAMLCIVICHVFQAYDSPLANLFNVGVPVFFCISGFLYGNKQIDNWGKWSVGRIKKVYLPYFILLVITAPLCAIFAPNTVDLGGVFIHIVNLQGFTHSFGGAYIAGISNTWFVTAIMLCYLMTPLLQYVKKYSGVLIVILTLFVIAGYVLVKSDTWMFVTSWLYLYSLSYFYANLDEKQKRMACYTLVLAAIVVVLLVIMNKSISHPFGRMIKDIAGLLSVTVVLKCLSSIKGLSIHRIVDTLSKYSYEIYLVNYVLLLGPLTLAHTTQFISINIILCILTIVVFTYILATASKKTLGFIESKK